MSLKSEREGAARVIEVEWADPAIPIERVHASVAATIREQQRKAMERLLDRLDGIPFERLPDLDALLDGDDGER